VPGDKIYCTYIAPGQKGESRACSSACVLDCGKMAMQGQYQCDLADSLSATHKLLLYNDFFSQQQTLANPLCPRSDFLAENCGE
jgi:hypothetical protein